MRSLGHGNEDDCPEPTRIAGIVDAAGVAAGCSHVLLRHADGTVSSWGEGSYGSLGHGDEAPQLTPMRVAALADVVCVGAGGEHSAAVRGDGALLTWGGLTWDGGRGLLLGHGGTTNELTPREVRGLPACGAAHVACGYSHTVVVLRDGSVATFGTGASGLLGHGGTDDEPSPRVVGVLYGAVRAAA